MGGLKRVSLFAGLGLVLFFGVFGDVVRADLNDIFLKFQPYAWVQEEYTSNVDLSSANKKSDFITSVYPGIRFSTQGRSPVTGEMRNPYSAPLQYTPAGVANPPGSGGERYGLDLDYRLGLVFYSKRTGNNYIGHYGSGVGWYALTNQLTFRMSDYLNRSEEPLEQEYPGVSPTYISGTFVDLTNLYLVGTQRRRSVYLRNVVSPSVEYQLGRDSVVSLNYRNNIYRPEDPASENSVENYVNPKLVYWFDIRNGITLEYGLDIGNFQRSPHLTGHMALGRYTYRFNPRTSVFGEYTFLERDFESPGVNYRVHTPSIGFEHALSPTLSVRAQGGYFWQSPEEGSGENGPFYDVLVSRRGERTNLALLFQGGYREDFFTAENRGFMTYHRAVGSIDYRLMERVTAGLSASYEYAKSPVTQTSALLPADQRDEIWTVGGNVGWQLFRWIRVSFNLTYREDHSNIDNRDYNEFRGMIRAEATYK